MEGETKCNVTHKKCKYSRFDLRPHLRDRFDFLIKSSTCVHQSAIKMKLKRQAVDLVEFRGKQELTTHHRFNFESTSRN